MVRGFFFLFVVLSGSIIWSTLSQTPAFNAKLRSETVLENGRTPILAAMHDTGEYEYQRGFGFLNADLLFANEVGGVRELASETKAEEYAAKAKQALQNATRLDPGNGHAWAALAWAEAGLGNSEEALDAVRVSWRVAPHNLAMAETRLNLIGVLVDPEFGLLDLTDEDRQSIATDLSVLRTHDQSAIGFFALTAPFLFQKEQ